MDIYPGKTDKLVFEGRFGTTDIRVLDKLNGLRYLTIDGVQHGGHIPGQPGRLVLPYFKCTVAALAFLDAPRDYLFIGLGMGAVPSFLRTVQPDSVMDVAEIEPAVRDAAKEHFGLIEDDRLRVHIMDGREFVKTTRQRYDAVFLDAYQDVFIPPHLTTLEFMNEVKAILKPGGVAVSNLWGSAVNPRFDSCISIIAEAFPHLYRFKSYTHNYIIVGDTKEEEIQPHELLVRAKKTMQKINFGFDLVELIRRQIL